VTIAYLSGSKTHDKDFELVEPSLLKVLKEFTNTILLIVGPVKVSAEFNKFDKRFIKKEFISYDKFQDIFTTIDINLVPLDIKSNFCQSKSELKFIEAGAYAIPSIVSATIPHKELITHAVNGFLVESPQDWYLSIVKLMDHECRKEVGQNARLFILENYSPYNAEVEWKSFLRKITSTSSKSKKRGRSFLYLYFCFLRVINIGYSFLKSVEKTLRAKRKVFKT